MIPLVGNPRRSVYPAKVVSNHAAGRLVTSAVISTARPAAIYSRLSVVAMMPTHDGFIAHNSWAIPPQIGQYTVYLNVYEVGIEANDEICDRCNTSQAGKPFPCV